MTLLEETLFQVVDVANPATVDAVAGARPTPRSSTGFRSGLLGGHSNGAGVESGVLRDNNSTLSPAR